MPTRDELMKEMGRRRAEEAVEARRITRRDLTWTALQCVGWAGVGIFLILWSAHTTDLSMGRAAFYAGVGIGNGGWIFTALAAYARGERRGDW